ncbi:MAG TPA: phosphotransacetylase family protein [Firmicutes bacterium]|nr:phosphotransacetylase family protein [Bacillota bacterium]
MPKILYLMGSAGSGKTVVAIGLAKVFQEAGFRVSYFKPKSKGGEPGKRVDDDVVLMKELLGLNLPYEIISPFRYRPYLLTVGHTKRTGQLKSLILTSFDKLQENADILLVEGSNEPYISSSLEIDDYTLAADFGARVLIITKIINDFSLDSAIFKDEMLKNKNIEVTGHIFNNVRRPLLDKTRGIYQPLLEEKSILLGIIPEHTLITSPTVQEFQQALNGEVLVGENCLDRIIEDVVVGSMNIDSALSYLRRCLNKAVITGGDRSDLALTALETSTSALILTGGLYPDVSVLTRAEEKNVPVILVYDDTYATIEKVHHLSRQIKPGDEKIINLAYNQVKNNCDIAKLLELI